jgi:hypothetical protein
MKITALALSTVLLCSTGALGQNNTTGTPNSGSSMTTTQPGDANGGVMQNNTPPNNMNNTRPVDNGYGHSGGNWGWIGLFGLLGLFGIGGKRNRADVVGTTTTTRP